MARRHGENQPSNRRERKYGIRQTLTKHPAERFEVQLHVVDMDDGFSFLVVLDMAPQHMTARHPLVAPLAVLDLRTSRSIAGGRNTSHQLATVRTWCTWYTVALSGGRPQPPTIIDSFFADEPCSRSQHIKYDTAGEPRHDANEVENRLLGGRR